ncbi:conserved hypothetical protein [delta proteobacterium NaphS2]|nr:conserved hypothetical protein [delta proteobacterium NaphS2]
MRLVSSVHLLIHSGYHIKIPWGCQEDKYLKIFNKKSLT